MKICINALNLRNHLGGIGWYCFYLVKYLKKHDPSLDITLLTNKGIAPLFYPLKEYAHIKEMDLKQLWLKVLYFQCVFPFLIGKRFDLLHTVGNIGMLWCPVPQIITICDTYEKVCPERFGRIKRTLMGLMISLSGRNAAGITAISKNTAEDIARFYPHLRDKTKVIYLGNRFSPVKNPVYRPQDQFIFVGTIEPGKNLATVLKALAIFNNKSSTTLKVIGAPGWEQSPLFALLRSLNLADKVIFSGYVTDEQLKQEYQSSRALICASVYEGFGLPVIEALACGCPVIAARNSAIVEAGDDCVLYFDTMDEKELAEKMLQVATNPESVQQNIAAGLVHAGRFTWEQTAEATHGFYLSCMRGTQKKTTG
jgi:glycosyltransferase involved in cell wall biosynthesis